MPYLSALDFYCYSILVEFQKDEYRMTPSSAVAPAKSKMPHAHAYVEPQMAEEAAESQLGGITANLDVFQCNELCQILLSLGGVPDRDFSETELRRLVEAAAWERYRRKPESLAETSALVEELLTRISVASE